MHSCNLLRPSHCGLRSSKRFSFKCMKSPQTGQLLCVARYTVSVARSNTGCNDLRGCPLRAFPPVRARPPGRPTGPANSNSGRSATKGYQSTHASKRNAALGSRREIEERRSPDHQWRRSMSKLPQLPRSSNPASPSRHSSPWIDLIAFLAVLALGGIVMAFGRTTAGSLPAICAALGGLYGVWKRFRSSGVAPPPIDEPDRKLDERSR
jgi:hypothetical protein